MENATLPPPRRDDLDTPEKRISYAAHIYQCYEDWQALNLLRAAGLSDEEMEAGEKEGYRQREERRGWVLTYGAPEYGSWKRDRRDGQHKPEQLIPQEFWS